MFLHVIRGIFLVCLLGIALSYITSGDDESFRATREGLLFVYHKQSVLLGALGLGVVIVGIDILISRKSLSGISGLFLGLITGMLITFICSMVIDLIVNVMAPDLREPLVGSVSREVKGRVVLQTVLIGYRDTPVISALKLLVGVVSCYLSISLIIQTKDDIRFIIPYVEFEKQIKGGRPFLLDTSAIIDGRILDVAKTRIFDNPLVIPRFVLQELQYIADAPDRLKRNRGRRGLEIINKLQTEKGLDIEIMNKGIMDDRHGVDQKLVALAEELKAKIVTADYNLNRVAHIRGVDVVNLNDLGNSLKPVVLPGEAIEVKIIKAGEEPGQGIGYMSDGTMVVVEGGRKFIGSTIPACITSSLQTSAGKMIFARLDESEPNSRNG
jgi:uncharacterized protein YacL